MSIIIIIIIIIVIIIIIIIIMTAFSVNWVLGLNSKSKPLTITGCKRIHYLIKVSK